MSDPPKGPDVGRLLKYDQQAFVQRLIMGMVLSPPPRSPLAHKHPNPLDRPALRRRGKR